MTMSKLIPESQILPFAEAAKEYVKRSLHLQIEENEESLAFVDHYVRMLRKQGLPKEEIGKLVAAALGVHFGQVVLAKIPGHWYALESMDDVADPSVWRVELLSGALTFSPVFLAWSVLYQKDSDAWDVMFSAHPKHTQVLQEAFARLAPVTEEYYYSFTGKLETLEYALEVLMQTQASSKANQ